MKASRLGRRVEKAVYDANGSGGWEVTPTEVRRFMYDDWRMILELDDEGYVLRQYTWGLDLSGTRGGAGGIGGLLGVYDAGEEDEYIYFHDAQGNVGQVVGWVDDFGGASGSAWHASRLVACYEYAPYGEILASSGDFAAVNPFRFSTKYHDDETGLIDFGRRLYDPLQGRWIRGTSARCARKQARNDRTTTACMSAAVSTSPARLRTSWTTTTSFCRRVARSWSTRRTTEAC
ncbi:MAG: RHS repeat-associated core domain-containing protein [Phycisphaerae bacterium]